MSGVGGFDELLVTLTVLFDGRVGDVGVVGRRGLRHFCSSSWFFAFGTIFDLMDYIHFNFLLCGN